MLIHCQDYWELLSKCVNTEWLAQENSFFIYLSLLKLLEASTVEEIWGESCPLLCFPLSPLFQSNHVQNSLEFKIQYFPKKYSCYGIGPIFSGVSVTGFLLAWYSEIFFFFLPWFKITCLTCWFIACHVRLFPLGCIFLRWSNVFLKNVLLLPWNIRW